MKNRRHIGEFPKTSFAHSGRVAGTGITEGDYSEESWPRGAPTVNRSVIIIPFFKDEKHKNGPVIIIKASRKLKKITMGLNEKGGR